MKQTILLFVFFVPMAIGIRFSVLSQNTAINTTGAVPNASALLDVDFTNNMRLRTTAPL